MDKRTRISKKEARGTCLSIYMSTACCHILSHLGGLNRKTSNPATPQPLSCPPNQFPTLLNIILNYLSLSFNLIFRLPCFHSPTTSHPRIFFTISVLGLSLSLFSPSLARICRWYWHYFNFQHWCHLSNNSCQFWRAYLFAVIMPFVRLLNHFQQWCHFLLCIVNVALYSETLMPLFSNIDAALYCVT